MGLYDPLSLHPVCIQKSPLVGNRRARQLIFTGVAVLDKGLTICYSDAVRPGEITHRHLLGELNRRIAEIAINAAGARSPVRGIFGDRAGEMPDPALLQNERERDNLSGKSLRVIITIDRK